MAIDFVHLRVQEGRTFPILAAVHERGVRSRYWESDSRSPDVIDEWGRS